MRLGVGVGQVKWWLTENRKGEVDGAERGEGERVVYVEWCLKEGGAKGMREREREKGHGRRYK